MIDGLSEDTTGYGSLESAGAAITSLLFPTKEAKQEREVPRKDDAPPAEEPEEEIEPAEPTDEGDPEQPTDEEEPTDPEEEPEPAKPEPRKLRVKVDGEELELPEDEVVKGYSRTADYTRKTQKHAEVVKAFEAEQTAVRAERLRYATQLSQLDELLQTSAGTEPDWDTLRSEDPITFAAAHAEWDLHQKRISAVKAEKMRAEEKVNADRRTQYQNELVQEAAKLVEAIPAWSDPEVAKTEKADIATFAKGLGYTPEELSSVADHRIILLLRDAMRFRQAEKKRPEIEKKIEAAKVLAPSTPAEKRTMTEQTRRNLALAKTGSLKDAGAAIELLLKAEKA